MALSCELALLALCCTGLCFGLTGNLRCIFIGLQGTSRCHYLLQLFQSRVNHAHLAGSGSLMASLMHHVRSCSYLLCSLQDPGLELDANGKSRIPYRPQGWNFWTWQGHKVHYLQAGALATHLMLASQQWERSWQLCFQASSICAAVLPAKHTSCQITLIYLHGHVTRVPCICLGCGHLRGSGLVH